MGNNILQLIFTFHNAATAIADGGILNVSANYVQAIIAVTGNATNFNLKVQGKANDTDEWSDISVVNLNTLALSPDITANGKYQLGLEGLVKVKVKLTAIGAGAVTAKGTVTT